MNTNFAKAFRVIRAAYGLQQSQLAKRIGISASQLCLIEKSKRQPSLRVVVNLGSATGGTPSLITLLAANPEDVANQDISDLAKALLLLLVKARDSDQKFLQLEGQGMKSLVSSRYLASRLGIPRPRLLALAKDVESHYRKRALTNPVSGKRRKLQVPDKQLMVLQWRILKLLTEYPLPDSAHGGVKKRSPKTNADQHLGQEILVNMDIRDFSPELAIGRLRRCFARFLGVAGKQPGY